MLINPIIDITLIALAVSMFTFIIQEKTGAKKKMEQSKKQMDELKKKIDDLQKNPEKNKKEIENLTHEMLKNSAETMKASFGTMKYTMIPVLIVFILTGWVYGEETIVFPEPMVIPWFGEGFSIVLYTSTNWFGWYILISLVSSIIINLVGKRLIKHD